MIIKNLIAAMKQLILELDQLDREPNPSHEQLVAIQEKLNKLEIVDLVYCVVMKDNRNTSFEMQFEICSSKLKAEELKKKRNDECQVNGIYYEIQARFLVH